MKTFEMKELLDTKNSTPGKWFTQRIWPIDKASESLGGALGILEPGLQMPYHFHNKRHTLIMALSGEATEIVDGKEIPLKPYVFVYILPLEKHMIINKTGTVFRYLELFAPTSLDDFIEVK